MALRYSHMLVFFLVSFLVACQPSYVVQTSGDLVRKVGVVNHFTITRWNNHLLQPQSRIAVVSDVFERVDSASLSRVVARNLAPYFLSVEGGLVEDSLTTANAIAAKKGHNYLFYLELGEARSVMLDEEDSADEVTSYNRLTLTVTILDAVSGKVIDKVSLRAKSSWVQLLGDDMHGLLKKPVTVIGKNLTGA